MMEFKITTPLYNGNDWMEVSPRFFRGLPTLGNFSIRINGVVYSKPSDELANAYEKEKMWERLNG